MKIQVCKKKDCLQERTGGNGKSLFVVRETKRLKFKQQNGTMPLEMRAFYRPKLKRKMTKTIG